MHIPTVGTLASRIITSIRLLSLGRFAIVAILTMSASSAESRV
jgi:hypothetical protein